MEFVKTITQAQLPEDQYVNQITDKWGVFLHHTASSGNAFGVLDYWVSVPAKVATAFIIAGPTGRRVTSKWKDGEIVQCFPSTKAGWHLGVTQKDLNRGKPGNKTSAYLNLNSVGIEICNYGYLVPSPKGFKAWDGTIIPDARVTHLNYRGYHAWESYSEAQLESVRNLLLFLCDRYDIDKAYKGPEMFEIDPRALRGERGIWTHTSVRPKGEKWDCYPHPQLIKVLESL